MNACDDVRRRFVEALYGELDAAAQRDIEHHLEGCPACAAVYARVQTTLQIMDQRRAPQLDVDDWEQLAQRLEAGARAPVESPRQTPPLDTEEVTGRRSHWTWAWRTAAALGLVAVGILLGRFANESGRVASDLRTSAPIESAPGEDVPLDVRVDTYMQRAETLLVGFVNLDPAAGAEVLDFDPYRQASRRLVGQAPELTRQLSQRGERRLAELVADLEATLQEIAALEAGQDLDGVEVIREGVDRQGLLFKIHLESTKRSSGTTGTDDDDARRSSSTGL